MCVGTVNGTHIAIIAPKENPTDYAFGCLKGQWRCLTKRNDTDVTLMASCCVLHNICELQNNTFKKEWMIPPMP